jgi:hypothetical protein
MVDSFEPVKIHMAMGSLFSVAMRKRICHHFPSAFDQHFVIAGLLQPPKHHRWTNRPRTPSRLTRRPHCLAVQLHGVACDHPHQPEHPCPSVCSRHFTMMSPSCRASGFPHGGSLNVEEFPSVEMGLFFGDTPEDRILPQVRLLQSLRDGATEWTTFRCPPACKGRCLGFRPPVRTRHKAVQRPAKCSPDYLEGIGS